MMDTYRNTVSNKRNELAKIKSDLAKIEAQIASLQKKNNSASESIKRTKNQSTMKNKSREIEHNNKSIATLMGKSADLQKKLSRKEKELITAEKNLQKEEERIEKKKESDAKRSAKERSNKILSIERQVQQHEGVQAQMLADIEALKSAPNTITVLFLAANPNSTMPLRLDEEVRSIQEKIRASEYRDSIHFQSRWAVRSSDILQAINETNPAIVHFSGHGTESGDLVLQNPDGSAKIVTKEAMAMAISTASDSIRLVVFNACFSEKQAKAAVENVEVAIGMSKSIRDDAAQVFAAQLYSSIGFGCTMKKAFNQAIAALMLEGIPQEDVPQIFTRENTDLNDIILVNPYTEVL